MNIFIKLYLIALPIFFLLDMTWLGLIAKNFYKDQIGFLMKTNINWTASIIFYMLFVLGLVIFAVEPAVSKSSWLQAVVLGALFGFFTYATYDLTNLATLKDWPILLTFVDIAWGTILGASVSFLTYYIALNILG